MYGKENLRGEILLLTAFLLTGCMSARVDPPEETDRSGATVQRRVLIRHQGVETNADVYLPENWRGKPLVIVAHGFSRGRRNMAGWGRFLAEQDVIALVPDLPHFSDHQQNARFLVDLVGGLQDVEGLEDWRETRVGLMGFSAGGLATLLAAAELPELDVWIGLDPVDRDELGLTAAPRVSSPAWVLLADPSSCNAQGNAAAWTASLPHAQTVRIQGASHVDGENPTDWLAGWICGAFNPEHHQAFQRAVLQALKETGWLPDKSAAP